MNITSKHKNFVEIFRRKKFQQNEIFFKTCSILKQSKYSSNLDYFLFKRRFSNIFFTNLKNRCIYSGLTRSVNVKLKMARFNFSSKVNSGFIPGFYRSI